MLQRKVLVQTVLKLLKRMVNNLWVDPDEWFNPLDKMPIANGSNKYAPAERLAELEAESNPRQEEEIADWFSNKVEKPDESDEIEEEKTIHQKMYEIATDKYNPFSVGGSETLGGSENRT